MHKDFERAMNRALSAMHRHELAKLLDQAGPCREELASMILEVMAEVDTPDKKQAMIIRTAAGEAVGGGNEMRQSAMLWPVDRLGRAGDASQMPGMWEVGSGWPAAGSAGDWQAGCTEQRGKCEEVGAAC